MLSYRDRVISIDIVRYHSNRNLTYRTFDKQTWADYAEEALGDDAQRFAVPVDSISAPELRAYHELLGVGVYPEYGWMCEYSTVGMPPEQRRAAVTLVDYLSSDLLRRVLVDGPNLEGRIYAVDALLYIDQVAQREVSALPYRSPFYESRLLTAQDRAAIEDIIQSGQTVRTCGNAGSYKIYPKTTQEVLSDSALAEIPSLYEDGWLQ
ncbi:MAG: hypothetical protein AAFN13_15790, partial [Bacteroidota bacterium]